MCSQAGGILGNETADRAGDGTERRSFGLTKQRAAGCMVLRDPSVDFDTVR